VKLLNLEYLVLKLFNIVKERERAILIFSLSSFTTLLLTVVSSFEIWTCCGFLSSAPVLLLFPVSSGFKHRFLGSSPSLRVAEQTDNGCFSFAIEEMGTRSGLRSSLFALGSLFFGFLPRLLSPPNSFWLPFLIFID